MKKLIFPVAALLLYLSGLSLWAGDYKAAYEKRDFKTAFKLARPLAEKGDPQAQYRLAVMHEWGEGVPKDYQEAGKWMRKAASQGHAEAQSNLGWWYCNGYIMKKKERGYQVVYGGSKARGGQCPILSGGDVLCG